MAVLALNIDEKIIREKNLSSTLKIDAPNEITKSAVEEGRRLAFDKNVKGYKSMAELKAALEE